MKNPPVSSTSTDHHLPGAMEITTPALTLTPCKQGGGSDHQCAETISISSDKLLDDDDLSCAESSGANSDGVLIPLPSTDQLRTADNMQDQKERVLIMKGEDTGKDMSTDTNIKPTDKHK